MYLRVGSVISIISIIIQLNLELPYCVQALLCLALLALDIDTVELVKVRLSSRA